MPVPVAALPRGALVTLGTVGSFSSPLAAYYKASTRVLRLPDRPHRGPILIPVTDQPFGGWYGARVGVPCLVFCQWYD